MKLIIRLYYLFYLIVGGYRQYAYEYEFINSVQNGLDLNIHFQFSLVWAEMVLFALAFALLIFPAYRLAHLLFGLILFFLDLYFQNFIKFESSIILTHLFPLFVFLILRFSEKTNEIKLTAIYIVSIGYCTSFLQKILSGWLLTDDLVIYGYIQEFSKGYGIKGLFTDSILQISSRWFWKLTDYIILLFQLSFSLNFITTKFVHHILLTAALFHLLILLFLDIGVFFPYVLFYGLILTASIPNSIKVSTPKSSVFFFTVGISTFVFYFLGIVKSVHFFFNIDLDLYMISDFFINIFCFILFIYHYQRIVQKKVLYEY
jgi:hypothetical protein